MSCRDFQFAHHAFVNCTCHTIRYHFRIFYSPCLLITFVVSMSAGRPTCLHRLCGRSSPAPLPLATHRVSTSVRHIHHSASTLPASHDHSFRRSSYSSIVRQPSRTVLAVHAQPSAGRILRRSFAGSSLQNVVARITNNKPLQLWIAGGLAIGLIYSFYNQHTSENSEEVKVWDAALATLSRSTLVQQLHGLEAGSRVRLVCGKRLSGYTEATTSDVWYEVRAVEEESEKKQQEAKSEAKEAEAAPPASSAGRVLGVYKVRVTASRDQPELPTGLNVRTASEAAEALAKASPEWKVQSITLSAPSRQSSFHIDPISGAVRRSEEFITASKLPSASPSSTATSTPPTNDSRKFTWSQSFLIVCGLGATSVGIVYGLRHFRRRQLLGRLQSVVRSSLSAAPLPLGQNVRVVRVASSKIGDAMMRAEMEVAGDRPGTAGSGRVRLQAVRSSQDLQAGRNSDWQVVHSQLTTTDGRTHQLWLPNIPSQ